MTHLSEGTLALVGLRISQLGCCGIGVYGHSQAAKRAGETEERLIMVSVWRDAPFFTEAERAALDLAEWVTAIAHRGGTVPVRVLTAAARHFALSDVVALLLVIVMVNASNRAGTRNSINQT